MTEEEKKKKSVGVRRNLSGDVVGDYAMRQDNVASRDIRPKNAPDITSDDLENLDYVENGKKSPDFNYNNFDLINAASNQLLHRDGKKTVDVKQRYTKPDGEEKNIKMGEMYGRDILRLESKKKEGKEAGVSSEDLQKTHKVVDPDAKREDKKKRNLVNDINDAIYKRTHFKK